MLESDMHKISEQFASGGTRKKSPTPLKMINFDMQADIKELQANRLNQGSNTRLFPPNQIIK